MTPTSPFPYINTSCFLRQHFSKLYLFRLSCSHSYLRTLFPLYTFAPTSISYLTFSFRLSLSTWCFTMSKPELHTAVAGNNLAQVTLTTSAPPSRQPSPSRSLSETCMGVLVGQWNRINKRLRVGFFLHIYRFPFPFLRRRHPRLHRRTAPYRSR